MTSGDKRQRFQIRESPLTIGLRDPNHRATYSFFFAAGSLAIATNFIHYLLNRDVLRKDIGFLRRATEHVHIFYLQEIIFLLVFTLILLPSTVLWMKRKIYGFIYGIPVFLTLLLVTFLPIFLCLRYHVHPALRVFFVLDQVRHWMRLVSFVVENVRQVRHEVSPQQKSITLADIDGDCMEKGKLHRLNDVESGDRSDEQQEYPTIKCLMYFMFAPTLIYQHSYPRSEGKIRWTYVFSHMCILDILLIPIIVPVFRQLSALCEMTGKEAITYDQLIEITFWSYLSGALMLAGIGYEYVHCWHNGQAEMMRFGDREFYKNWWSASDAFRWMSVWNLPVQRWLSDYVYKPAAPVIGSRVLTVVLIFLVSGLSHDYILSFTMGFYVPVFTCVFLMIVPSIPVILLVAKYWKYLPTPDTNTNTFLIYIIAFGAVSMFSSMEYFARINCPLTSDSLVADFFVPRFPSCSTINAM